MLVEHLKVGQKYRNATRHQIVEITQIVGRLVWYRIIEQDTNIAKKEPSKSVEHFTNSYVKL